MLAKYQKTSMGHAIVVGTVLILLLGTQLLIGCGGESGSGSAGAPGSARAPTSDPSGPGTGGENSGSTDVFKRTDLPNGHSVFVDGNDDAVVAPKELRGELLLVHSFGIPSANLGFLSGYSGSTWSEKCQVYRPEAAFRFYEMALESGDAGEIVSAQDHLKTLTSDGQYTIGHNQLKIAFESDDEARVIVTQYWPSGVPRPRSVRALRRFDLQYDVQKSEVLSRALVTHDGLGFHDIEKLPEQNIPAYINQYCDLLLGKIAVHLSAKVFAYSVPLQIGESVEGVRP